MQDEKISVLSEFDDLLEEKLNKRLWRYQSKVAEDLMRELGSSRLAVVMMPTGSGKTILEAFTAYYLTKNDFSVLVLEPTRFLVDQAYHKVWKRIFDEFVGSDYEGRCDAFRGHQIIVSTPQTALKCSDVLPENLAIVVDEVHHAYSSKYYSELVEKVKPSYLVGFSALVPYKKRIKLPAPFLKVMNNPSYLTYDFANLESMGDFSAPKAVLDVYDAELEDELKDLYTKLYLNEFEIDGRAQSFLANTLMRYGLDAYCDSLKRVLEREEVSKPCADVLRKPCLENNENHKVKALLEALRDYWSDDVKPILIYTSRVATARRIAELVLNIEFDGERPSVCLITGQTTKAEREKILRDAHQGKIDVIVSTRVGEEGVDLPEAGMLVLMDTSPSPLRFYQRLGRLIRRSKRLLKYLIGIYTVETAEYEVLPLAIANLQAEGVDVSYVIANLEEKGLTTALKRHLMRIIGDRGYIEFPELIPRSRNREKLSDILEEYFSRRMTYTQVYNQVERSLRRIKSYRESWKLINEGEMAYFLESQSSSEILAFEFLNELRDRVKWLSTESASSEVEATVYTVLRTKPVRTLYSLLVPIENAEDISEGLIREMREEIAWLSELVVNISVNVGIAKRGGIPLRMTRRPLNTKKRVKWISANLESTLIVGGNLAGDLRKLLKMNYRDVKFLRLTVKIPDFRLYGFIDPPNISVWKLNQEEFSEQIACLSGSWERPSYTTVVRWEDLSNSYLSRITSPDGIKARLLVRSLILSILKAWRRILERTYLED